MVQGGTSDIATERFKVRWRGIDEVSRIMRDGSNEERTQKFHELLKFFIQDDKSIQQERDCIRPEHQELLTSLWQTSSAIILILKSLPDPALTADQKREQLKELHVLMDRHNDVVMNDMNTQEQRDSMMYDCEQSRMFVLLVSALQLPDSMRAEYAAYVQGEVQHIKDKRQREGQQREGQQREGQQREGQQREGQHVQIDRLNVSSISNITSPSPSGQLPSSVQSTIMTTTYGLTS